MYHPFKFLTGAIRVLFTLAFYSCLLAGYIYLITAGSKTEAAPKELVQADSTTSIIIIASSLKK